MNPLVVYGFVFVSVSAAVALVCLLFVRDDSAVQLRLNELSKQPILEHHRPTAPAPPSPGGICKSAIAWLGSYVNPHGSSVDGTRLRLIHAGIYAPSAVSFMTAVRLLAIAIPVAATMAVGAVHGSLRLSMIYAPVAGAVGMVAPTIWLVRKVGKRKMILSRSLPDFLDVMVVCLESGMSFESSLQRTTEELLEAHPELAGELEIVQREITLGKTVETALENLAMRSDLAVIRLLATNVQQSRKLGIRLADNLRTHADLLRRKRENRAEEMAHKAAVKILLPSLLCIFPAIFVVMVGPAYFQIQDTFSKNGTMQVTAADDSTARSPTASAD